MVLIADSGSTKTDWRAIDGMGNITQAKTAGMNPYQQTREEIYRELADKLKPQLQKYPEYIFFYGAGCATDANAALVRSALEQAFSQSIISVSHDLLAAARALCNREAGIACILGTGSNSCLYDGSKIISQQPSLGYVLGDEGSGAVMGKTLVSLYLTGDLPDHLMQKMDKRYNTNRDEVVNHVYKQPFPNRYLADFSQFLFHNLKDPFIYNLVYNSFAAFFDRTICRYDNYKEYKVHFVGSVAFYYSNVLRQVANDKGIIVKNILETPIAGLALYHQGDLEVED